MPMDTFLGDLGTALQGHSLGTLGTDTWLAHYPDSHDPKVTVGTILTETAGYQSDEARGIHFPRVQIVCRHTSYALARARAHAIYAFLNRLSAAKWGTTRVFHVAALQPPFAIGIDAQNASRIACNYQFEIA